MVYHPLDVVEVRVWGQRVGGVALDPGLRYYAFEYAPAFIRSGIELAPLTMPLAAARQPFVFPTLAESTYFRLPGLLADALPDAFGNSLIDAWMAHEGVSSTEISSLDRLAYMSHRATGALEFRPARGPSAPRDSRKKPTAIKLAALVEAARRAVRGDFGSDAMASAALAQLIQVGTSAGGARAKAAIAWNPRTREIRAGQFDVPAGFEHWLIKFDGMGVDSELGASQGYGRIEYAYYLMAKKAGIAMSPSRLFEESGRAHFMTRRFDRAGNTKIHMQSLCGLAHLDYRQKATHDVSQLFLTIDRLRLDYRDKEEAFRRVTFNVAAKNCDDHTKNVTFLMPQGEAWRLAPAYDLTFAHNPAGEWTYQHLMAVNGKFADITRDDLLEVAEQFGIGTAKKVIDQVSAAVKTWPMCARQAKVPALEVNRIAAAHVTL